MAGLSPLSAVNGQIEVIGNRKSSLKRINLGPINVIPASNTVTVTQTLHFISEVNNQDILTILGGEEGDLLILLGEGTKLKKGGNIANQADLGMTPVFLIYDGSIWNV